MPVAHALACGVWSVRGRTPRKLKHAPLSPNPSLILRRRWIVSARPTWTAPPVLHSILVFLLLLVELFLLLVVEKRAHLLIAVLADLHHFAAHRLPVIPGIVSQILHLLSRVHENRFDLRLLSAVRLKFLVILFNSSSGDIGPRRPPP